MGNVAQASFLPPPFPRPSPKTSPTPLEFFPPELPCVSILRHHNVVAPVMRTIIPANPVTQQTRGKYAQSGALFLVL